MDFLKKHYEKLILAIFLIAFVFLLLYLIDLSKSMRTITRSQLEIPTIEPNYKPNDFSKKKYETRYIFTKNCTWNKSKARTDKDQIYTDLLVPFPCARCVFCHKVIPRYYYLGAIDNPRNCPLCEKALPRPVENPNPQPEDPTGLDRDNDGIPTAVELKMGLDPNNPDDAFYDADGDGFPNITEYKYNPNLKGKNIKSSKLHPDFYKRLQLIEFRETLLPFQLKLVNTNGKKDPKDWDIQINETIDGRIKTRFKYLGSRMTLDKTDYKITKIDAKHEEKRRGGTIVKVDNSKIYLNSVDGKYTITMQVGKDVYSPKPKAIIEDLAAEKKYHVGVGDSIVMPMRFSKKTGKPLKRRTVKYKVFKVDRKKKNVVVTDKKYKKYIITAKAFMPRIKRKDAGLGESQGMAPGGDLPPGIAAPPGVAPARSRTTRRPRRTNRNF